MRNGNAIKCCETGSDVTFSPEQAGRAGVVDKRGAASERGLRQAGVAAVI